MLRTTGLLLGIFLASWGELPAAGYYRFDPGARQIYQQILSLRLTEAAASLAAMKQREPDNLIALHLENYLDFFDLYIREDEARYRAALPRYARRLAALSGGDPTSPYHLYVQAEIRLHWALLRIRFEDFWPAFTDINRAHRLLLRNQELFPAFAGNRKDLGILHAAVGAVPDEFRWGLQLLTTLDGTVAQGKREIEQVLADTRGQDFPYRLETQVLYAFLLLHLDNRPDAAWTALHDAGLDPAGNPLHCFVLANVALRTGRNDQALRWLSARPRGAEFLPFPFMSYMRGLAELRRLNPQAAQPHFQEFLRFFRGRHYIKEAYQKLGWCALLSGNPAGYAEAMQLVRSRGHQSAGGDKNAAKEAASGQPPQPDLLRARLLFDGGYYSRANEILVSLSPAGFGSTDRLEYQYRRGRVLHGLRDFDQALRWYDAAIAAGRDNDAFFACNAALQAGLIEEERRRPAAARSYYQTCLQLRPAEYATGLHHQAKAGLQRLR